ncbi:MAG: VWA domain-containing protein [Chloroflexi bacterium]|nr:VWA domain-containing protein [Chloroflexota bacterium]
MSWLDPAALAFALLAIPILLLYLLRMQRREHPITSTLLWRQVLPDREANTLWQRLRRNLLLFLQLAALAALVFALTRPFVLTTPSLRGSLIVLLDASASMRATDVAPSRFDAARTQVREIISHMSASDRMQLVLVDDAPHALTALTDDRVALITALDQAIAGVRAARWVQAVSLAGAAATAENVRDATIVVVSDGANLDVPAFAALRTPVQFLPVGVSSDNLAVTTLRLRRRTRDIAAFVRVMNFGAQEQRARLTLAVDDARSDMRDLIVAAGASTEFTVDGLPLDTLSVHAHLDAAEGNALAEDDDAYAVAAVRERRRTVLVGSGNRFLEQALTALPGWDVTRAATPPDAQQPFDLYVLDGFTASVPSGAGALIIGVAPNFAPTSYFTDTRFLRADAHPVLEAVDWRPVAVQGAQRFDTPPWLQPVLLSEGGPLLYAGVDAEQRRIMLLPFSLNRSDLPLQIAFPILVANAAEWLAPAQGLDLPADVQPGEVVPLPANARVEMPDGAQRSAGPSGFAETMQPGMYLVHAGAVNSAFAVNFTDDGESALTPSGPLTLGTAGAAGSSGAETAGRAEIWPWLAVAALLLLTIEWWMI